MSYPENAIDELEKDFNEASLCGFDVTGFEVSDNMDPEHKLKQLKEDNENLKKIVGFCDASFEKMEALFSVLTQDLIVKCEELTQKNERYKEEVLNLDRAYQYTYGRLAELRTAFETQQNVQAEFTKTNNDLRKALELSATRINELMTELAETKEQSETDISKLNAALRLDVMKISRLESTISDLTRQNEELTTLCEEFLS